MTCWVRGTRGTTKKCGGPWRGAFWVPFRVPFHVRCGGFGCHTAPRFMLAAGPFGRHSAVPFHASVWELFRARFALAAGSLGAMPRPVSGSPRVLSGDIPLPRFTLAAGFVGAISRPVSRSLRGPWVPFRAPFHARRLFCSGGIPLPRFTPAAGPSGRHSASRFTLAAGTLGAIPRSVSRGHCGTKRGSRGTK